MFICLGDVLETADVSRDVTLCSSCNRFCLSLWGTARCPVCFLTSHCSWMAHSSSSIRVDYVEAKDDNFAEQMRKLPWSVRSALSSGNWVDPEVLATLWEAAEAELSGVLQDTGVEGSMDLEQLKVLVSLAEPREESMRHLSVKLDDEKPSEPEDVMFSEVGKKVDLSSRQKKRSAHTHTLRPRSLPDDFVVSSDNIEADRVWDETTMALGEIGLEIDQSKSCYTSKEESSWRHKTLTSKKKSDCGTGNRSNGVELDGGGRNGSDTGTETTG